MKTSTQFVGVLVVMAAVFALNLVPMASNMRALTAALIIVIGAERWRISAHGNRRVRSNTASPALDQAYTLSRRE